MKDRKTTKQDFESFKKECQKWIERFGLKQWAVYYDHEKIDGAQGQCEFCYRDGTATITLTTGVISKPIETIAKHEVLELLTAGLYVMAVDKEYTKTDYEIEQHKVIRILEHTL